MGLAMTDFSLDLLIETLPSKVTQKNYKYILNKFLEFGKFSSYDNIIETDVKKLDKIIKAYIISLKSTMNPNSIPSYADAIKSFLEANDVDLNWRRIRKLYPRPAKKTGQSAYSTEDIQLMLKHTAKIRNKVFIHFLASTAVRVSALDELKMKDLRDMPHGCKMVTVYADDIEEYKTFLTPEASYALGLYHKERQEKGEILDEDSLVFVKLNGKPVDKSSTGMIIHRALVRAGLKITNHDKDKGFRHKIQLNHGFRKRFNTILKLNNEVNDNAIEKMMGHSKGLDSTYLQITDEKLFDEFWKGVDELTVSSEFRDKLKIRELEKENAKVSEEKIQELQDQINEIQGYVKERDKTMEYKRTMKILESTGQIEDIPVQQQIEMLTPKQKDLLLEKIFR